MTKTEKLQSIRTRITNIRTLLEDPSSLTSVSAGGVSETIDRSALNAELSDLEYQEACLEGKAGLFTGIDLRRC